MSAASVTLVTLVLYKALLIGIGIWASRRTHVGSSSCTSSTTVSSPKHPMWGPVAHCADPVLAGPGSRGPLAHSPTFFATARAELRLGGESPETGTHLKDTTS